MVDEQLLEKLQLDPNLTLKRAVDQARQKEAVRKQQAVVRCNPPGGTSNVDAMRAKPKSSRHATTKHQKNVCFRKMSNDTEIIMPKMWKRNASDEILPSERCQVP